VRLSNILYRLDGIVNGMTAVYLTLAIASEVIATLALKSSEGFSRPLPAAIVVVGYGISFFLLALVLKHMSVGTTYAVWSAVGTAAIAIVGIVAYGEGANLLKIASLGLIILGVVGLNAAGAH
jgi:small multidrug resistance pump